MCAVAWLRLIGLLALVGVDALLRGGSASVTPDLVWANRYEPALQKLVATVRVADVPEMRWPEQLKNVSDAGAADPCGAPALLTLHACEGFGWRLNALVNEIMMAMQLGAPVALCQSNFAEKTWIPHFGGNGNQTLRLSTCHSEKCNGEGKLTCKKYRDTLASVAKKLSGHSLVTALTSGIPEVDAAAWVLGPNKDSLERYLRLKRFTYRAVFELNTRTKSAVDQRLAKMNLNGQYVGVHIRRSDKKAEADPVAIERYAVGAAEFLIKYNISTVYVASDEPDWAAGALHDAVHKITNLTVHVVAQAPKDVGPQALTSAQKQQRDAYNDQAFLGLLTDVEALRRSAAFVGTASSNIGQLVYFLRDEPSAANNYDSYGVDMPFEIADRSVYGWPFK
eukprot:gnl/MRDRNA2_/MRDRNA2_105519_c0_seq1.p1 gnl/MRDRNA2_/MRDRNA2_105519_c0~~gnl/MRDRNA2_/MRDRNA2_105519_c0_seq1.p1  ORF type:complete len:394 (+),score=81.28 gnl/MRDRNA2_/MRDRNA2_105519_c0_seq1:118-1299(+)